MWGLYETIALAHDGFEYGEGFLDDLLGRDQTTGGSDFARSVNDFAERRLQGIGDHCHPKMK